MFKTSWKLGDVSIAGRRGRFVMSVSGPREARMEDWAHHGSGLCREVDWNLRDRAVGKAEGMDHGDRAEGMKSW